MSYELYGLTGSCSMAVHVILNELGEDAKIHLLERGEKGHKSPEYLKLNPRGQVPLLIEDGKTLREGAAQIIYLCDTHKSPLLPQSGWERAQALQWLMVANASLHPAYSRATWISRNLPDGEIKDKALKDARSVGQSLWDEIESHLSSGGPYLCGKNITAGDILIAVIGNWNTTNYTFGPKTKAMFKAVIARPSYQKALEIEGIEYKAAA